MDGEVSLKVSLDTKSFEKQIKRTELELKKMEKQYEFLTKINEKRANSQEKTFSLTAKEYEMAHKLGLTMDDIGSKNTYTKLEQSIEKSRNKLIDLNKKQDELNNKDNSNAINSLKNIGSETENIIKKVAKWGLAIFSVRSAYNFVRQSVSTLSQYNEKIGTDIQYIRFALASSLQPLIEGIIKLVYKLLAYINYIAKAWFGVNLFANASAKAFQKVNKGVKDTNKSAKALSKTLLGFDEMNILQKDGSTSIGGGGGGIETPSMDLSNMNVEIPSWIKWLAENGELIKNIIIGIGQAFLTWKLLQWTSELGLFAQGISKLSTVLQGVGIALIVVGIFNAVKDLIDLIQNPSWDNFYKLIGDLSIALTGLGLVLIGINASNPFGWIALGIGLFETLITKTGLLSDENEELANQTKSVAQAEEDLTNAREARTNASKKYSQAVKDEEKTLKALEKAQKKNKISGESLHKEILIGTKNYKDLSPAEREVYDAYLDHLSASEKLTKATEDMTKATYDEKQAHNELTGAVYNEEQVYDDWFQTMIDGYRNNKISAQEMANAMKTSMNEMSDTARRDFVNNLPDDIRNAFNHAFDGVKNAADGTTVNLEKTYVKFKDGMQYSYKELGDASSNLKTSVEKNMESIAKKFGINLPNNIQKSIDKVDTLSKKLAKLASGGFSSGGIQGALSISVKGMKTGGILKLASGAVINNPGKGVPLRSDVIGGEQGREGILPLTDQQAMSQLGYEIGRNITLNTTLNNYMNGRLINKELMRVQNEDDFAFNG